MPDNQRYGSHFDYHDLVNRLHAVVRSRDSSQDERKSTYETSRKTLENSLRKATFSGAVLKDWSPSRKNRNALSSSGASLNRLVRPRKKTNLSSVQNYAFSPSKVSGVSPYAIGRMKSLNIRRKSRVRLVRRK